MPLTCISSILFTSDAFWGNTTLSTLRLLLSTSKGFHNELMIPYNGKKSKTSLTEHALLTMMQQRPKELRGWRLTFEDASYCFSLRTAVMIKHCRGLPSDDKFHMSDTVVDLVRKGRKRGYIRFMDAFRLVMNSKGGLAAAMQRRHQVDIDVLTTAKSIVPQMVRMLHGIDNNLNDAVEALTARIEDLATPKKKALGETTAKRALKLVEKLRDDAFMVRFDLKFIKSRLLSENVHTLELKKLVRELKFKRNSIAARYKAYSMHCPEKMTMDCFIEAK
jgi:hypothetical protein